MTTSAPTQQDVPLFKLDESEDNPNVMTDKEVATLATAIGKFGALQPILVATNGVTPGRFRIVDGHHRSKACRLAGRTHVAAVVLPADYPLEDEATLRIAMNRLRGELDLTLVSAALAEMLSAGRTHADLLLTGYGSDEINALLRAADAPFDDDLLDQDMELPDAARPSTGTAAGGHVLEVAFHTKADMTKAKRALKRAAAGGMLGTGLLALIEGD